MDMNSAVAVGAGLVAIPVAILTAIRTMADLTRGTRLRRKAKEYLDIANAMHPRNRTRIALEREIDRTVQALVQLDRPAARRRTRRVWVSLPALGGAIAILAWVTFTGPDGSAKDWWLIGVAAFLELVATVATPPTRWRALWRRIRRIAQKRARSQNRA